MTQVVEGKMIASGVRFGLVVSRFNSFVTSNLLKGAVDTIAQHGGTEESITIVHVPGAMEIPLACKGLIRSGNVDVVIALGAVIRGETPHFDQVCNGVTSGVMQVTLESEVPVIFGVLTTDSAEQALARSGVGVEDRAGNKGCDAALAAMEMVSVMRELSRERSGRRKRGELLNVA